jgi:hypothetical protein
VTDISAILKSIENTRIADGIRNSLYWFPALESIHVMGLAIVFGTILVVDLRLLGIASRNRPFRVLTSDVLKWTWLAFVVTFVSGALMFSTNATVYYHSYVFRAKMLLLLLAAMNAGIFEATTGRAAHKWGTGATPRAGKAAAVLSVLLWISILCLGRWIGFTVARSGASTEPAPEINLDDIFGK